MAKVIPREEEIKIMYILCVIYTFYFLCIMMFDILKNLSAGERLCSRRHRVKFIEVTKDWTRNRPLIRKLTNQEPSHFCLVHKTQQVAVLCLHHPWPGTGKPDTTPLFRAHWNQAPRGSWMARPACPAFPEEPNKGSGLDACLPLSVATPVTLCGIYWPSL